MQIEAKDFQFLFKVTVYVIAGVFTGATGLALWKYKISDLSRRVQELEDGKVGNPFCKGIRDKNEERFKNDARNFQDLKELIRESNRINQELNHTNQRHYEEIMKHLLNEKIH